MCGLAGFAEVACTEDAARALLKSLADCLAHRGPDGSGTLWHAADRVGLAHRRLAILDAGTTGDQPMVSATGRTAIAFNGEIVNAPELARSLRNQGVALRGHSDTEVLLEAIEAWGIDRALELCAGMFAFALHDRSRRRVHLVRDRMGVKPLHWMRVGRGVAFASEVRALRRMPGAPDTLDPAAVVSLLSHGCVTGTRCVWSGVEKLAPGHRLEFDAGSGEVRMIRWWDPLEVAMRGCARPFRGSDRDAVEAGRSLAARVVREHLLSDVPVACFLSGGIDSRLVAALALGEGVARPPRCFTAGFDDAAFDERDEAGRAARALGLAWESFEVTERAMVAAVPDLATVFDEPFADSSQVPTLLLARRVREHAPVALSGDGGDELFGGYRRHVHAHARWDAPTPRPLPGWTRLARALPAELVARGSRLAARLVPALREIREPDEAARKWLVMHGADDPHDAYARLVADGHASSPWWREDAARAMPDALRRFQFMDQTGYLVDDPLVKMDRASMSCGLEVRVPLLDHRLVEFAWSLPAHMKVRDDAGKWLLRGMLEGIRPGLGAETGKRGFSVPLVRWLRGPLRAWAGDLLADRDDLDGTIDFAEARRVLARAQAGSARAAHQAWRVLTLAAWARRWRSAS